LAGIQLVGWDPTRRRAPSAAGPRERAGKLFEVSPSAAGTIDAGTPISRPIARQLFPFLSGASAQIMWEFTSRRARAAQISPVQPSPLYARPSIAVLELTLHYKAPMLIAVV